MENMLLDLYEKTGNDYETFAEIAEEMSDMTKTLSVRRPASDLVFLSLCNDKRTFKDGYLSFYWIDPDTISSFIEQREPFRVVRIPRAKINEELAKELEETTQLAVLINKQLYIVSENALATLSLRASVGGATSIRLQNFIRNLHFADAIFTKDEKINFIYRSQNVGISDGEEYGVKKIFAAVGYHFNYVPQTLLSDVIQQLQENPEIGSVDVVEWEISHKLSSITVEFPDMAQSLRDEYDLDADFVPGVRFLISDIGYTPTTTQMICRVNDSTVIIEEIKQNHSRVMSEGKIGEEMISIFYQKMESAYKRIPSLLAELKKVSVIPEKDTDDDVVVENTTKNYKLAYNLLLKTYRTNIKKVISVSDDGSLLIKLSDSLHAARSTSYTYYDIAMILLTVPEKIRETNIILNREKKENLGKVCGSIPAILRKHFYNTQNQKSK